MLKRIPLGQIDPNPDQPRKIFDERALRELAASIRENGLKQPITVRPDGNGRYLIVMGERRWRAHQILAAEGKGVTDVLCQVSKADDRQLAIDAIIENDQRVDVTPLEQARAYQRMIDEFEFDVDALAVKLGKDAHRIQERLNLLNLTEDNQRLMEIGVITPGQAWYLMQLSPNGQAQMLNAIKRGLCPTTGGLKSAFAAIKAAEEQRPLFELGATEPTEAEVRSAAGFEAKVERIADMLRAGIAENEVVAMKKVDPTRAATLADLFAAMQKDMRRIEEALRILAVQQSLAA